MNLPFWGPGFASANQLRFISGRRGDPPASGPGLVLTTTHLWEVVVVLEPFVKTRLPVWDSGPMNGKEVEYRPLLYLICFCDITPGI